MASPHKRRGKKINGSYGKTAPSEVVTEAAPKVVTKPEPKPKKKKKDFFDKE